jgi:hypothetical protein
MDKEISLLLSVLIWHHRRLPHRQDELALATGVGRRFLIDLEAGKPTCQLGRSLLVADALGLTGALAVPDRARHRCRRGRDQQEP